MKLYALFKQSTIGSCNTPKPGMMDFVGKAKWNAWTQLGKISKVRYSSDMRIWVCKKFFFQEEAEKQYIDYVNELSKSSNEQDAVPASSSKFKEILTSVEYGNIYKIVLNRPKKRNAITLQAHKSIFVI